MLKKPLVSIIIPAYNEEANIGRLLKSIRGQKYQNIEVIVVDDSSQDKTAKIARELGTRVYTRKHQERSIQRNYGASRSRGDYLLFLDADMELTPGVVEECVSLIDNRKDIGAIVIPEATRGDGFIPNIRRFEREMYFGDSNIEVARFFERSVFEKFGGYDPQLTGPEDFDLPYRISKSYGISRIKSFLYHHEQNMDLFKLLKKRFYYASHASVYADKHPELISKQGILILRRAYFKHWRKFLTQPIEGLIFILVRFLETVAAIFGYVAAVGLVKATKTFFNLFKKYG